jgi:hypothetical protein
MSIASLASGPVTNIILFYFLGDDWGMRQMSSMPFRLSGYRVVVFVCFLQLYTQAAPFLVSGKI